MVTVNVVTTNTLTSIKGCTYSECLPIHTAPTSSTSTIVTSNDNSVRSSTVDQSSTFKQTSSETLIQRQLTLAYNKNITSNSSMINMKNSNNITRLTQQPRPVTVSTSYYNTNTSSGSDSSLSGGAIAGIVIGVLALICCLCLCGCCKSGHWETQKVWVKD